MRADEDAVAVCCGALTALGLLGDLSIVRNLVDLLSDPALAAAAADALYVITGAPLWEKVLIPDELSED